MYCFRKPPADLCGVSLRIFNVSLSWVNRTSGQQAILALASNESICLHKLSQEVSKSIDSKQIAAIMGNI